MFCCHRSSSTYTIRAVNSNKVPVPFRLSLAEFKHRAERSRATFGKRSITKPTQKVSKAYRPPKTQNAFGSTSTFSHECDVSARARVREYRCQLPPCIQRNISGALAHNRLKSSARNGTASHRHRSHNNVIAGALDEPRYIYQSIRSASMPSI